MALSVPDLDQIAEEFASEMRAGGKPQVDEYLRRYPDPSGELAQLLSSIEMIENLKRRTDSAGDDRNTKRSSLKTLDMIDDYRILREIGRGGMGIVYEAIHCSLERRVALKVLSAHLLSNPKHLSRFRREARAAARLRHPNIVPVFGVGSTADYHYYVMDLIDGRCLSRHIRNTRDAKTHRYNDSLPVPNHGQSLAVDGSNPRPDGSTAALPTGASSESKANQAELIAPELDHKPIDAEIEPNTETPQFPHASPEYWSWVATIGAKICSALQYAHEHGVLHRDIKPGNLILDSSGEVWVADFGLAKLSEQSDVTGTGEILGTPQYIAPEALSGHYDKRSEIYAVGLTLYELLVLEPAISGNSAAETLRNASRGVSRSLKQIVPKLPRDLDTIIMKALALQPEHRYKTAAELGSDLECFSQGRPISARRIGVLERGVRWAQREPLLAWASGSILGMALLLTCVSSQAYWQTNAALRKQQLATGRARAATERANSELTAKLQALTLADTQKQRAERNLQTALTAFDEIIQSIVDRSLEIDSEFFGEPSDTVASSVSAEDAQILRSLLVFFDELAANNSDELIYESAKAAQIAGDIYVSLGQLSEARLPYLAAEKRYRRLCTVAPDSVVYLEAYLELQNDLLTIHSLTGQAPRAHAQYREIQEFYEASELAQSWPEARFLFARACRMHASLESRIEPLADSNRTLSDARASPNRAFRKMRDGMLREENRKAQEILSELAKSENCPPRYQVELARCLRNFAQIETGLNHLNSANESIEQAVEIVETLLETTPNSTSLQYELAMTLVSGSGTNDLHRERLQRANDIVKDLLATNPKLPRFRALQALTREMLGGWEFAQGNVRVGEALYWQAIRIYSELLAEAPEARSYQFKRVQALGELARIKIENKDIEGAKELLQRAISRNSTRQGPRRELSPSQRRLQQRLEAQLSALKSE